MNQNDFQALFIAKKQLIGIPIQCANVHVVFRGILDKIDNSVKRMS